jgi:hypothetical protein
VRPITYAKLARQISEALETSFKADQDAIERYQHAKTDQRPHRSVREEMTELEVCRLSAEALGKKHTECVGEVNPAIRRHAVWIDAGGLATEGLEAWIEWNPLLNAEQRWECVEWLLKENEIVFAENYQTNPLAHALRARNGRPNTIIHCPDSEFPARAVAELQRRK